MELRELEYVTAIADAGSLSKAADRLYLAQSSLSQFLNRLESELGTKLFVRTSGGVRPTLSGEIYIRSARQILRQYQMMRAEVQDMERPSEGRIDFGISSFRGEYLFPKVLDRFRKSAPAVEVVIHEMDSIRLHKAVSSGELDMALVAFPDGLLPQKDSGVRRIKRDEVMLVANKEHPVMQYVKIGQGGPPRPWVDLSEILHFEFLLSNRTTILGSSAERLFRELGKEPRALNTNLTASFAAALARQGLGLAFTYRSCAIAQPGVEYLSIGKKQYFADLALLYPPDGYRSRAIRALEETFRQCLEEDTI